MSRNTNIVPGENWVVSIYDGGQWKPYCCARSGSIYIDTDLLETTVTGSGNWRTYEPSVHGFTASLDGVCSLSVADQLSIADLQALQIAKTKLYCRFTQTSVAGDVYIKQCYLYITNSTDTGSFDGIATFQLSLRGTGAIVQIFTPPSPTTGIVYRYPAAGSTAPATTESYTWVAIGLANKNILNVVKDGRGSSDIILTGTPVGNEVLYETSGSDGLFTWAVPFEDGETPPYVEYQNT